MLAVWAATTALAPEAVAQVEAAAAAGVVWQRAQVLPRDAAAEPFDEFGGFVALTKKLAVVAAPSANGGTGRVHIFSQEGGLWGDELMLAPQALAPGAGFGNAVAASDTRVIVGAPFDGDCGSAWLLEPGDASWAEIPLLVADCAASDRLGTSVAISGDTAIVGSPFNDTLEDSAGAAYVFVRRASGWQWQATLLAADPASATPGSHAGHLFGYSVALDGDTAVVGTYYEPAAYVFERTGDTWARVKRLVQTQAQDGDMFGSPVALSGDVIAVAASMSDSGDSGIDAGAVYLYRRSAGVWPDAESQVLRPGSLTDNAVFGNHLTVSPSALAVSAPFGAVPYQVHTFDLDTSSLDAKFVARGVLVQDHPEDGDAFGMGVALYDRALLLGVPNYYGSLGGAQLYALAAGNVCDDVADCAAGFCVEGVCCSSACDATCESCLASRKQSGATGSCGLVKAGTDPRGACAPASCVDDASENPADYCSKQGACVDTPERGCRGYSCSAGACLEECQSDNDCDQPSGFLCTNGKCAVPLGGPCLNDSVCGSGHCETRDGICCDAACAGPCEACTRTKKGIGQDGKCGPTPADGNPYLACKADGARCGAPGSCDGKGSCRAFEARGTPCGDTTCAGDTVVRGWICSGGGECIINQAECDLYRCQGEACSVSCQSGEDCAAGAFCGAGGQCQPLAEVGAECALARECRSEHCVDGTCDVDPRCSEDESAAIDLQNQRTECGAFRCRAGVCLEACVTTADCAPELGCNRTTQRCEPEQARPVSSGCAFRHAHPGTCGPWASVSLSLLAYALYRTRSRRRQAVSHPLELRT